MGDWYFDIRSEPAAGYPGLVRVERVYVLDFDAFGDAEWRRLDELYKALPGWKGYGGASVPDQCPRWFSLDEQQPPYLSASVEPPGLQVSGIVSQEDWAAWDTAFRSGVMGLPKLEQ